MTAEPPPVHLRLLTLNCLGVPFMLNTRARLATLGRELNASDLDVICLQEVQFSGYLPLLRRVLPGFPYVAFERYVYAPKGGLVTLSRWPIGHSRFLPYTARGPWHTPALADWLLHKGVLVTHLVVRGAPVVVLNTHLIANYSGDWSPRNRYARHQRAQLGQLIDVVNRLERRTPTLVTGDFNVPRGSWLYDDLVNATGLSDLLADSNEPTYRQVFLLPDRYAQAIDFVFVRPGDGQALTASAHLVFTGKTRLITGQLAYLSDHLGIEAEIQVASGR